MTENDRQLLDQARNARPFQWAEIGQLVPKADSPSVAAEIDRIAVSLYHRDEASIGCE